MNRREFGKLAIGALAFQSLAGIPVSGLAGGKPGGLPKVPLGMCDHAIRTMRPNADQLIDYAIEHRLDSIILNSFRPLESRDDDYLARIRARAAAHDVGFHVGAGSVSEKSTRFSDRYGNARETLEEGIRVAAALGSPVVTCRIGTIEDRYTEGGIEAHVEAVIALMKSLRSRALDAGVKFAFENHAGDLRSKELLALIEETGPDVCGAILDFGNAIWAMEDPIDAIRTLGPHILTTSVRDVMLWETGDGAMFQWVAVGQGLMDFPLYVDTMAELCPGTPLHVESISNSPRPIPYLTPAFWKGFP
ncbi:MAG: TIM barrel protein, partial [Xanthomonadales bacterium]|nr:sugar phosphate isomerase/epimerase [Xanthomonadales bacterium]NIX13651.1 TIM barrel protein [Xanthomonadales bacterium]